MRSKLYFWMLIGGFGLAACNQETKKPVPAAPVNKAPVMMEPFKFHKLVEAAPGNDFDVVSWGRGATDKGSFIILHSDSAGANYTTTTGDLDGPIVDVYNTDMDVDGNPEIIIQSKTTDTNKYVSIYAFEFNGSKANKLEFPRLTVSQRKGYRGGDNFYIADGKLMRGFSIYNGNNKDAKPTAQKRLLEYSLHGSELSAKQVSKDSIAVSASKSISDKSVADKQVEKTEKKTISEKSIKHNKKKHHHEVVHRKKKKHRHHHSEE